MRWHANCNEKGEHQPYRMMMMMMMMKVRHNSVQFAIIRCVRANLAFSAVAAAEPNTAHRCFAWRQKWLSSFLFYSATIKSAHIDYYYYYYYHHHYYLISSLQIIAYITCNVFTLAPFARASICNQPDKQLTLIYEESI